MRRRPRIAVFGGTFDPIHNGHLRSAQDLLQHLDLDEVRLMPARIPPHRPQPQASAHQRLRMLQLAANELPRIEIDERELGREGPSYSSDSLEQLRAELGPEAALCLVVGADAFAGLPSWRAWTRIPELAHILVLARPGYAWPEDDALGEFCRRHQVADAEQLFARPQGGLLALRLTPMPVSATDIRARIQHGEAPHFLLPESVWQYIRAQGLYRNGQEDA